MSSSSEANSLWCDAGSFSRLRTVSLELSIALFHPWSWQVCLRERGSKRERDDMRWVRCVCTGPQLLFFFKFPPECRNLHLSSQPNALESSVAPPRHLFEWRIFRTSPIVPGERDDFQTGMNSTSGSEGLSDDLCFSSFCHSGVWDEWMVINGC